MPTSPKPKDAEPATADNAKRPSMTLPLIGVNVTLPPADRAVYYGGIAALAVAEMIEWPIALAIVAGDQIVRRNRELLDRLARKVAP
ncbi:MAG: hypothetical protein ACP5VR_01830 [Acidimicrobiales bacterium]